MRGRPGFESVEPLLLLAGDPVLRWNQVALDAVAADYRVGRTPEQAGPTATARALAIVQIAVYDAYNAINPRAESYHFHLRMPRSSSIPAAVAKAAHDTLAALYPRQKSTFDAALAADLAAIPDGRSERLGVRAGRAAAGSLLNGRSTDGSDAKVAYDEPVDPGTFEQYPGEAKPLGPGWGSVRPFAMGRSTNFEAPPPPEFSDAAYATAYNEVKSLGGDGVKTPTVRTPEQTQIGLFWAYDGTPGLGTPPRLYNQIVRTIARQEHNSVAENARLFALANMAMADAGIAGWETKYDYDTWRPIRGIRQTAPDGSGLDDGNPDTQADPTWTPLGAPATNCPPDKAGFTPPFPSYVSGHATFGAAVFRTLADFYGRDNIPFTFTSQELDGVSKNPDGTVRPLAPRAFTSFSQAATENAQSRIYLGIHWGFDRDAGIAQGDAVADFTYAHEMRPLSGGARPAGIIVPRHRH